MSTVSEIMSAVASCAPEIRDGLPGRRVAIQEENPSGEEVMEADVFADDLIREAFAGIDGVGQVASEEREHVSDVGEGLSVTLDPLDGSSNLKPNNTMGTVVGVYDGALPADGDDMVAAGWALYGPVTTMVVARDDTVTEYVVRDGEREVVRRDVEMPQEPRVYGFGGRKPDWPDDVRAYVERVEEDPDIKLRYGGSMIGDVNQVLTYGGVFGYPMLDSAPRGKLRLQYEGYPVAYVVETAGGRSSDGERSLLDVPGSELDLHERVPVFVGSDTLIDRLEESLA